MGLPDRHAFDNDPVTDRLARLEELVMFADHRHEALAAVVNELSLQIAAMHKTIEVLSARVKDAERLAGGVDPQRTEEDEVPPHNAF